MVTTKKLTGNSVHKHQLDEEEEEDEEKN